MNIKGALAALLGEGAKHEEVQAELDSLRLENILHEHQSAGRLAADPETVEAARKLAAHDPDALGRVLTASRPIAASQTLLRQQGRSRPIRQRQLSSSERRIPARAILLRLRKWRKGAN